MWLGRCDEGSGIREMGVLCMSDAIILALKHMIPSEVNCAWARLVVGWMTFLEVLVNANLFFCVCFAVVRTIEKIVSVQRTGWGAEGPTWRERRDEGSRIMEM